MLGIDRLEAPPPDIRDLSGGSASDRGSIGRAWEPAKNVNRPHQLNWSPHKLDWSPQKLGSLPQKLDWLLHKLDWLLHKLDWLPHKLDWLPHKLGSLPHKLDWLLHKLDWLPHKLRDFQLRQYRTVYRLNHQLFSPHPKSLSLGTTVYT